ncbi:MAG: hypothetical protein M3068_12375 [Gemmatimonadota bacterium]|nr:hypothetical protein [Gemmatimonadota bacterium]
MTETPTIATGAGRRGTRWAATASAARQASDVPNAARAAFETAATGLMGES